MIGIHKGFHSGDMVDRSFLSGDMVDTLAPKGFSAHSTRSASSAKNPDGLRVVIYLNDHRPADVHVIGDGTVRPSSGSIAPEGRRSCVRTTDLKREGLPRFERRLRRDQQAYAQNGAGFMANHKKEFEAANERARHRLARTPTITAARYDKRMGRLVIDLSSGLSLTFRPQDAQGFEKAKPAQLTQIEISPSGLGLHFPAIDADVYLPGLLEGFLGSRRWMAAQLGKAGGSATSRVKAAAVRANGKLGGRPRKTHEQDVAV